MIERKSDTLTAYLFILPTLIGFVFFMAYPIVYSIFLSFTKWNMMKGFSGSTFIGLKNYKIAIGNEYFQAGLINNMKMAIIATPILLVISLVIANLLNQKMYARNIFRVIYFVPYITTITASAIVFSSLFHQELGPINSLLRAIGVSNPPKWFGSSDTSMMTIGIFWIWRMLGYNIILILAGLQSVPKMYYEAATIDGANSYRKLVSITFPMVSPIMFFLAVTNAISSFQLLAEVKVMTNGGPGTSSYTLVLLIYKEAFEHYQLGYSSSIAILYFLIILVITGIQWIGQKKWVHY
jgi:multiple sugar transport system permease protein